MPLGTLDRTPPPFFKQGPSALSKLTVLSAVAIALMVVDARFKLADPVRSGVASVIYPLQWLVMQPVRAAELVSHYFTGLQAAQNKQTEATEALARQAMRAAQVELLTLENQRLRELLDIQHRVTTPSQGAQVLYDAGDPYTRKIVIDRGTTQGVQAGAPVLDGHGVLGQVTRAYPLTAEVTLLTDRSQAISVLNTRTGARSLAYGAPSAESAGLELRFIATHADIEVGDLLSTSGVDGVYPSGLPVGRVTRVERENSAAFARIEAEPVARPLAALHVLVLQLPPPTERPAPAPAKPATGAKR
ncbi:MAG TPA: rod shape-determining protein MreC [Burkholderiaceae bacterium]|jgi:rod shape-determining protein MreC|nr:rod shape-determining protein MreC [Burkholderiaceae bacterium]